MAAAGPGRELPSHRGVELPVLGAPRERADAARNRQLILTAARRIVDRDGTAALTMDAVAREAEVGVGTVYRRFGDLTGLALGLADEHEQEFQTAFLSGPPPLGPGAPPGERIRAFLQAAVTRTDEHIGLLVLAENLKHGGRFSGAYAARHAHLTALITEAAPDADAVYLADVLLAPLAANLYLHQRDARGMDVDRIRAGFDEFLDRLRLTDDRP